MAKSTGIGDNCYVGGTDVSGDINSAGPIRGGPLALDLTDITQGAYARQGGKRDGEIAFVSYFDTTTAHPVLSALPTADVHVMYFRGTAGPPGPSAVAALVSKQINYDGNRADDGSFLFSVDAQANGFGLEWGDALTAGKRTDTTATNGTGTDLVAVSTAFGWQAYLQVFSVTGTSVTVTVQDSADNISFANMGGGGGAFTAVLSPGPGVQRLVSPGATDTVRRYVRAITTGTFSNAVFAVAFMRNLTAVVF